jgi:flagellar protein FliS
LYDRLLLDLDRAKSELSQGDPVAARSKLVHAQDIVTALADALDFQCWDGAEALHAVYDYVYELLVRASGESCSEPIVEASRLLEPIREAWHAIGDAGRSTSVGVGPTSSEEQLSRELGVG